MVFHKSAPWLRVDADSILNSDQLWLQLKTYDSSVLLSLEYLVFPGPI